MSAKNKGIFVTGTGTNVGKTLISGAILRALHHRGIDCGVMKPIESGCRAGSNGLVPHDGEYLQKAGRLNDAMDLICPCRFQAPLSPYAAVLKGEAKLVSWPLMKDVYRQLSERHDFMLLEGAGGLMAPIDAERDMTDLSRFFSLPVLLVAQSGLGTLNHTLLSLAYGKARGLSFVGIVLNQNTDKRDASEASNAKILEERSHLPILSFAHLRAGKDVQAAMETRISKSAAQLVEHPLMDVIFQSFGL